MKVKDAKELLAQFDDEDDIAIQVTVRNFDSRPIQAIVYISSFNGTHHLWTQILDGEN